MTEKEMLQQIINRLDRIENRLFPEVKLRTNTKTKAELRREKVEAVKAEFRKKLYARTTEV